MLKFKKWITGEEDKEKDKVDEGEENHEEELSFVVGSQRDQRSLNHETLTIRRFPLKYLLV